MSPESTSTVEEQAIRWIHFYPRAWRAEHAQALLGTVLDGAEARSASALSRADQWDLARHGLIWRVRLALPTERPGCGPGIIASSILATVCAVALVFEVLPSSHGHGWRDLPGHLGPFATLVRSSICRRSPRGPWPLLASARG